MAHHILFAAFPVFVFVHLSVKQVDDRLTIDLNFVFH